MVRIASPRGWSLTVEEQGQWVEIGVPVIDPNWRYTDRAGHEHRGADLLVERLDDPDDPPFYFDDDGEEYNSPSHLECRLCGEWIKPGTYFPPPQWVPTYRTAQVEITHRGEYQRWAVYKQELIERLAADPDRSSGEVVAIVQHAHETGDAVLAEIRIGS